ncbi:MAG TPA: DUF4167 domain-containing protein [Paracoccaceae bacterium]
MRSSKSRSRSKSNRPRTMGNIVNRVFDSSGPEGKVRGTPQQIIEKYLFLARDAQLSNDRVAAENFLQHAEHYTRLLSEAQRELAAEQEARQNQPQQNGQNGQNGQSRDQQPREQRRDDRTDFRPESRPDYRQDQRIDDQPYTRQPEVIDLAETGDETGLVETPESRHRNAPRRAADQDTAPATSDQRPEVKPETRPERRAEHRAAPRPRRTEQPAAATAAPAEPLAEPAVAKDDATPRKPRLPRKPHSEKPRAEGEDPAPAGPREAAE